jgi:hypothetical protein
MDRKIIAFAIGALDPAERAILIEACRHDHHLAKSIDEAETMFAPMAVAAPEVSPSPGLFDRINAALDAENVSVAERVMQLASVGAWEPIAPGVDFKRLWDDRTYLLRCAAGAEIHSHFHIEDEHLLLLSGDLVIGGRTFVTGDFIGSPKGPDIYTHSTRTGCILFCQTGV